ncbi:unnamed protein product [Candidula unifasciata]|uniref:EF-hand domain-containing protein n=1 Tax=Candidula unifasciata TaxID=100452 RepID=A0A8S3YF04_9EUPU|nr:unnamed protein product [Candidula unifasciata]
MSQQPGSRLSRNAWDVSYGDDIDNDPYPGMKNEVNKTHFETEETASDREMYVKTTLRELIIYIIYLVVLCVITFGMTSTTMYYYTKVMSDLFLESKEGSDPNFKEVNSVDGFWKYAKGPLLSGLYWENYYNNDSLPPNEMGYIYYENRLLGVPRIRQLKVRNDSCQIHDDFASYITECFDSYSESFEDRAPFNMSQAEPNNTAWRYFSESELNGGPHWGQLSTYSGGGYYVDLNTTRSASEGIIQNLLTNLWIQRGTRAVFIDFTVYNANINLFCVVRLLVEFPATGGAIPSWTFRTVKLIRYVTIGDYFIMACEIIFCIFILYYTVEEILEIKALKLAYFKSFWNILDLTVVLISLVCMGFNIYRTVEVSNKLTGLLANPNIFADFEKLSYWETRFSNAVAIAVFIAWIKIFKYISFNKTMTQLSSTLERCAKDLAGFFVMFIIIFLAFTQLGYLLFGTQVKDFSSFQNAFFTLFRIILGDFDFNQLEQANRILGPIFFMLFVFFVFFVLINMFLAIINDTYSEVKSDMANAKNDFEIADYFKKGYLNLLSKLNIKREKIVDLQKALHSADINQDKKLDFEEWRQELKSRGYADGEIEAMFAKYDLDGDRVLGEAEQKRMQADLTALTKVYDDLDVKNPRPGTGQRSSSRISFNDGDSADDSDDGDSGTKSLHTGPISSGVSYEEFTVLSRRVDRMEHSIGSIVSKIDAVLVKLEAMEKAKIKRRETMGKILDSISESDGTSDELKREQMEHLVREELERWDSETSVGISSACGVSPGAGNVPAGLRPRSRAESAQHED